MSEDYAEIANRSWDEIPEVQTLPVGSWLLKARNAVYMPAKGDASPRILFFYTAKEPMDDVDDVALNQLGDDYDYADNDIVSTFWVERNKDWDAVRSHLAKHGIDASGKTVPETLKAFKGTEVIAVLGTKTYTTGAGELKEENTASSFAAVE